MLTQTLNKLFKRDLNKLKEEIKLYSNESNLWVVDKDVLNSGGNLCLHLVGNLNHFIGAEIGKTDYIRQRDLEFSLKNVPRTELIQQIDDVMLVIETVLQTLTEEDLQKEYSRRVFEDTMTVEYFLVHLSMHLGYHLGQINYHRRLLDS
jgi:uncharacterized damage-inducible protein DinB